MPIVPPRSAGPFWLRGPMTLTPDRSLVLDRAQAVEYQPASDAHMRASVYELANIHQPKDAVRFAEQRGLLWHGPDAADLREPFADWWKEANDLRKTLDLCLTLRYARAGTVGVRTLRNVLAHTSAGPDADVFGHPSALLSNRVNQKLADTTIHVAADASAEGWAGTFRLDLASASPLHHVYFQLAQTLLNNAQFAMCPEPVCRRFFAQIDPRQQYCSPTCANGAGRSDREVHNGNKMVKGRFGRVLCLHHRHKTCANSCFLRMQRR